MIIRSNKGSGGGLRGELEFQKAERILDRFRADSGAFQIDRPLHIHDLEGAQLDVVDALEIAFRDLVIAPQRRLFDDICAALDVLRHRNGNRDILVFQLLLRLTEHVCHTQCFPFRFGSERLHDTLAFFIKSGNDLYSVIPRREKFRFHISSFPNAVGRY